MQTELDLILECSHTEGPGHNCAYVERRNAQIPKAAAITDAAYPKTRSVADKLAWDARFLAEMDRLTADTIEVVASINNDKQLELPLPKAAN